MPTRLRSKMRSKMRPKTRAQKPAIKKALTPSPPEASGGNSKQAGIPPMASAKRLQAMLNEAEAELAVLTPKIERLENYQKKQLTKLQQLKLNRQKLITLRLSLQSILQNFQEPLASIGTFVNSTSSKALVKPNSSSGPTDRALPEALGAFSPEAAEAEAAKILKNPQSVNAAIFKAVVLAGGQADTRQIKAYLIEQAVICPGSKRGFEEMSLTEISSRVHYLVRKGLLTPAQRGVFRSTVGWQQEPTLSG